MASFYERLGVLCWMSGCMNGELAEVAKNFRDEKYPACIEQMDNAKQKNPNNYYRAQFSLLRAICKDDGTASLMDAISSKRTFTKLMKDALSNARDMETRYCEGESVYMETVIFIAERVCFRLGGRDHNEPTSFMKEDVKDQLRKKTMKELGWYLLDTHEKMFEIATKLMPDVATRKAPLAWKMSCRVPGVISSTLPFNQGVPTIVVSQPKSNSLLGDDIHNVTPPPDPASLSPISALTGSAHQHLQITSSEQPEWSIPRTPSFASQRYGQPQPWLDCPSSAGRFYSMAFTREELALYSASQGEVVKGSDDDDPFAFIKKGCRKDSQDSNQTSHARSIQLPRIPSSFTKSQSIPQENKENDLPMILKKENVPFSNKVSHQSPTSQPQTPSSPSSSPECQNTSQSKRSRRAVSPVRSSTNSRRINHGSHSELEIEAVLRSQIHEATRTKRQRTPTPPRPNGSSPAYKRSRSDELRQEPNTPPRSRESSSEAGSISGVVRMLGVNIGDLALGDGSADGNEDIVTKDNAKKIQNGGFTEQKSDNRPTEQEDDYHF